MRDTYRGLTFRGNPWRNYRIDWVAWITVSMVRFKQKYGKLFS